ncbi:YidC/Oxa1 family membrane protein insertase [Pseudobacteroides cellulosolvens]|uniref:Membrane protein insertase, YidC/Oxa1 family n=1 Tax=Pseudobacteroides cellulosolvens ATCC 35603 = DSM 2933 TaxID=398512 RepID=A0A0L6JV67_9FIRM|nr:YidC/Oxa1 family membrane protein insertase [Pseudobacteroides cellulosolvens]KNY29736.1 membrane protein insertase, YidC/Oxa1 family [Pseudobacteroides cellulosolvens ATCC 35603 = DSM 2933]
MLDFIAKPFGDILYFIYNNLAFKSYGIAIIIFTIFVKIILLPLMIKQYNNMAKMQELGPKLKEIQTKYKNDKEKLQQESMKLYQENNYNPMGGCLPLLIQMPILLALWQVIQKPLRYMIDIGPDTIDKLANVLKLPNKGYVEIDIIKNFDINKVGDIITTNIANVIEGMENGFRFLGVNLGTVPSADYKTNFLLLLIPILAAATTYISSKLSMVTSTTPMDNPMQKSMLFMGPLMTLFFSFSFPAGMGLYWIVGGIFQIFQQLFINKLMAKKKEVQNA